MNLEKYLRRLPLLALPLLMAAGVSSCLDDNEEDYEDWRKKNDAYVERQRDSITPAGEQYYNCYAPEWSPKQYVLIHWHTRPADWQNKIHPLSNSTVDIKYEGRDCDGKVFDSSYSRTTPADSIYRTRPNQLVAGFWAALTQMVPGDSVTVVIPAISGYGAMKQSGIKPYSALTFDIKLKSIVKFEK